MTDKIVVFTACANGEEAEKLARRLLEARLAACVNIVPSVRSLYWWQGRVEESAECLLVIKSRRERMPELTRQLGTIHTYELPEAIAMSVVDGSERYLEWIDRELDAGPGDID
jgi:periplasmic divalent cation tolerance protein